MGYLNKRLFNEADISGYLDFNNQKLKNFIDTLPFDDDIDEQNIAKSVLKKYSLFVPVLLEDEIKRDVKEKEMRVQSIFGDTGIVKGLAIQVKIPFKGDPLLFRYKPSTYTLSGTPMAEIEDGNIVLYYETDEKDADKIKQLWIKDIKEIKQYLERMRNDLEKYNNNLIQDIQTLIKYRKQEFDANSDLINKLKQ